LNPNHVLEAVSEFPFSSASSPASSSVSLPAFSSASSPAFSSASVSLPPDFLSKFGQVFSATLGGVLSQNQQLIAQQQQQIDQKDHKIQELTAEVKLQKRLRGLSFMFPFFSLSFFC